MVRVVAATLEPLVPVPEGFLQNRGWKQDVFPLRCSDEGQTHLVYRAIPVGLPRQVIVVPFEPPRTKTVTQPLVQVPVAFSTCHHPPAPQHSKVDPILALSYLLHPFRPFSRCNSSCCATYL